MTKRVFAFLMAFVMSFVLLAGCGQAQQPTQPPTDPPTDPPVVQEQSKVTPLLYKVTDSQGNVAWLFGSIHIGTKDFYPLPEYVLTAFDGSDALAVEVDVLALESDLQTQINMMSLMVYTDGTTIQDHIRPDVYEAAVAIIKKSGMYISALDSYMPVLWYSYVESCGIMQAGYDATLGVDYHMLKRAKEQGKEILEVESAIEQYTLLAGLSPELQAFMLENTVAACGDPAAYGLALQMLVGAWKKGNEEALAANVNSKPIFFDEEERRLYEEFTQALLTSRDGGMTQFAVDALTSGKEVFICVGAAHVVGEEGMVYQLQQLGYTVEAVNGS